MKFEDFEERFVDELSEDAYDALAMESGSLPLLYNTAQQVKNIVAITPQGIDKDAFVSIYVDMLYEILEMKQ